MNIEKAVSFIESSKDRVLTELAHFAVHGTTKEKVLKVISDYQLEDGGWTKTDKDFQANISTISTTWVALQWLIWLDAFDANQLRKTVSFLGNVQSPEGYWDESADILKYDPPPWMKPNRYENQIWLTSAICCKLKELGLEKNVDYNKALSFLSQGWKSERFPVFTHTHWMAIYVFHDNRLHKYKEIAKGCKSFLIREIENNKVDPGDYCAIAYNSLNVGEFAFDLYKLAFDRILRNQANDGGIITNYGEKHRAGFTLEALFLYKKWQRRQVAAN